MMYEGDKPYLFISYSHRNRDELDTILSTLESAHVRFWYDTSLRSGRDFNRDIASHISRASVFLLLLSPESAASPYVKDELNFAREQLIPLHTVLLTSFDIPDDIRLATSRIQRLTLEQACDGALLRDLPPELLETDAVTESEAESGHPLFERKKLRMEDQGTATFEGVHRRLRYPCLMQRESVKEQDLPRVWKQASLAAGIRHPVFPRIYDITLENRVLRTWLEDRGDVLLVDWLKNHQPDEARVRAWALSLTDAMETLFRRNLALRDFARGSLTVRRDGSIGILRLQNLYCGLISLTPETRQYHMEQIFQEIAIFLGHVCTGSVPALPLPILRLSRFSSSFQDVVNLVVQKCAKVRGRTRYASFGELKKDLGLKSIRLPDKLFLKEREKKLASYAARKEKAFRTFTDPASASSAKPRTKNLEEEFGFEPTVTLQPEAGPGTEGEPLELLVCSTGQLVSFQQEEVIIGRGAQCSFRLTQPFLSSLHARLFRRNGTWYLQDMGTKNGTYVIQGATRRRLDYREEFPLEKGAFFELADVRLQLR